ncbi:hypothetical protein CHLNCDRAFT_133946 [Chlorella variabilis]|uniref:CUE domain-containing protein n=1 Tax=Chlorella variabilis TaxID=554065 RepID=E1ZEM4_CHLVA|nr:hypothetical protein CHLNCDRAFT_133946 [Chlorella variabilis]EFN55521.1 hypothetical protein CHLNCDRAFT_133946 [Chlorella variabilis]|eukprot:XP_005847623.1 hypothetical protein CHLNCDRAFT_133946 [Chlorella variabilis]
MADFAALRDAFPATPPAAIEDALRRHGNADGAASELLQVAAKPAAGRWRDLGSLTPPGGLSWRRKLLVVV